MADIEVPSITDEHETVIEFLDAAVDNHGRRMFRAYWLADNIGPASNERGVRGQVFSTDVTAFVKRQVAKGRTVRKQCRELAAREDRAPNPPPPTVVTAQADEALL